MMRNYPLFLVILLAVATLNNCRKDESIAEAGFSTKALQIILDSLYVDHPEAIGIMAHVEAPDQGISWSGAAGINDSIVKSPLAADDPVLIASNTKTYVAAAVLKLIEDGKLELEQPIVGLISDSSSSALRSDGYELETIQLQHLLSHTSGIFDYVNAAAFFETVLAEPGHRWTREEQIALAISDGDPQAEPGETFAYADINYSLLTEIIEGQTQLPFYTAIRELLNYEAHDLDATWWETLEEVPADVRPLAHQYITSMGLDNYLVDPSFDLYGGGGIAATTKDLARFSQLLFSGKFYTDPNTLDLIYTEVSTLDSIPPGYSLGLTWGEVNELPVYGHGGFWGTAVNYIPAVNASISVFILERDARSLRQDVIEELVLLIQ